MYRYGKVEPKLLYTYLLDLLRNLCTSPFSVHFVTPKQNLCIQFGQNIFSFLGTRARGKKSNSTHWYANKDG